MNNVNKMHANAAKSPICLIPFGKITAMGNWYRKTSKIKPIVHIEYLLNL